MQIVTKSGKTLKADWVLDTQTRHGIKQLTIQIPGNTAPDRIIRELVGLSQISCTNENGNCMMYEGYTKFYSLIATSDGSALRLTLEKGDAV